MRNASTYWLTLVFSAIASTGWAQTAPAAAKHPSAKPAAQAAAKPLPQVRAEMHRTIADLLEAQAAEKPDPARIKALTEQLQKLRGEWNAQGPAAPARAAGWGCLWGGPGYGWGGPGYGRGQGYGRGPGYGWGGWGGGQGYGRGMGLGAGRAFVDSDSDGICDNFEIRTGRH
jgi:hypothetical protein